MPPNELLRRHLQGAALGLAAVALLLLLASHGVDDIADTLRVERDRRRHLEDELREKRGQLDGALEKIHELAPDDGEH